MGRVKLLQNYGPFDAGAMVNLAGGELDRVLANGIGVFDERPTFTVVDHVRELLKRFVDDLKQVKVIEGSEQHVGIMQLFDEMSDQPFPIRVISAGEDDDKSDNSEATDESPDSVQPAEVPDKDSEGESNQQDCQTQTAQGLNLDPNQTSAADAKPKPTKAKATTKGTSRARKPKAAAPSK